MSDIELRWSQLPVPTTALQGFELRTGCGVWLSIDSDGRRCVLLHNDTIKPSGTPLFETKGVSASVEDLQLTGSPASSWIVVVCRDSSYWEPFQAFAESLNEELTKKHEDNVSLTLRVLRTWRWLWTVDPSALTRDSALGLIGELWFLIRWAGMSAALTTWVGPERNLHDFAGEIVSVEVKTSQSTSRNGPVHRINSLQQLTPLQEGTLYLFSIVIVPDPGAGNTLSRLIQIGLEALANDPSHQELFRQKLARVGCAGPVAKEFDYPFRVVTEQLYKVDSSFPSLREGSFPNGVPSAVGSITYDLDISACSEWRVATSADMSQQFLGGLINGN